MPTADPTQTLSVSASLVPAWMLDDGEIVILAIKPSPWFVLLASGPVVAFALALAAAGFLAGRWFESTLLGETVALLALLAGALRVVVAGLQWMGRLYVLTNRRILRLRGAVRVDVFQAPLHEIEDVSLAVTRLEGFIGNVGSLFFGFPDERDPGWLFISQPLEVKAIIEEAVGKARKLFKASHRDAPPTGQSSPRTHNAPPPQE
jgi:hypothetical protein